MLEALFTPQTLAVIGASRSPGKVGHEIVANLIAGGYSGTLVLVNPTADEILGHPCLPDLSGFPGDVDLGIVTVPTVQVEDGVRSLARKNAKAIIVITAGFKETGPEGAALQERIARFCKDQNIRLLGPNVVGLVNTHHRMNASFALRMPATGNISVIAQSGAICTVILDWVTGRKVGIGKLVSIGNKADLCEIDIIQALARDERTKVIVGYLEDIQRGVEFVKAAEEAAEAKPVVLLKVGTSEAGRKAASSHTGSLAGEDIAYGAAFARAGVIRAPTFEAMLDHALAFSMQPLPRGNRVAIITNAGGLGIIAADAVESYGMKVAQLSDELKRTLKPKLPAAASVGNPIDVLGDSPPERYAAAVAAAQEDPGVDAIVVLFSPQAMTKPIETAQAIAESVKGDKPVLAAFMGGNAVLAGREALIARGIPDYPSAERAVASLRAMVDYSTWKNRPPRVVEHFPVNRRRVERILNRYQRTGRREVGEVEAKEIFRAYGFTVPEGVLAANMEEAVEAANRVGYPVAMKIYSPDILHKSDFGGVRINLGNPDQVRDAYDLMMLRIGRRAPNARLDGVYVEQMARRGREVIIGMTRDKQFGPMLMFGLGGIFVEVMKDVTFHLAPITAGEAMEMLKTTRSYALLKGVRGEVGVDMERIADAIQRISQLATDFPQIVELDINPLIVGPVGAGASVADGRMSLDLGKVKP